MAVEVFGDPPDFLVLTKEKSLTSTPDFKYLGKWSIDYQLPLESIQREESHVLEYPFDEENSLESAYNYLQRVDQHLFAFLTKKFNQIHQLDCSERYWRIIAGYWWREYIEVVFERYYCLKYAFEQLPDAKVKVINQRNYITPYDSKDFSILYKEDFYNHQLYSQIIEFLGLFRIKIMTEQELSCFGEQPFPELKEGWQNKIKYFMCLLSKWNQIYFSSAYLKYKDFIKIALSLKSFPTIDTPRLLISQDREINCEIREKFTNINGRDEFEKLIIKLLAQNIPKIYIEDFSGLRQKVKQIYPANKMKSVVTSNSFASNEGFKLFTAEQVENFKTPYIILQHGGQYGCGAWNSSEDFEKETADYYLSYGWEEKENKKVVPFIVNRFNIIESHPCGAKMGDIIWVSASFPRYSYTMYSVPVGPQFVDYLDDQAAFLNALPDVIKKVLRARIYRHSYGWNDVDYLRKKSFQFKLAELKKPLLQEAKKSRLIVCTYNATAHLETFSMNVPTLLYWNPKHWKLRPEAKPLYDALYNLEILHHDPVKAARKMEDIADNTLAWWAGNEIQQVRKEFCRQYAACSDNYTNDWLKTLRTLSGNDRKEYGYTENY